MNNGDKRKIPFSRRFGMKLGITDDIINGSIFIEIRGRRGLTLCGCKKILKYESDEIILGLKDTALSVRGYKLTCITYYAGTVGIEGYIDTVMFTDGNEYQVLKGEQSYEKDTTKK